MIAWMINVSKPKKIKNTTSSLVETQFERIVHYWRYSEFFRNKNDSNFLNKKKALYIEKPKFLKKMAKVGDKSKINN